MKIKFLKFTMMSLVLMLCFPISISAKTIEKTSVLSPQFGSDVALQKVIIEEVVKDGKLGTRVKLSGRGKSGVKQSYDLTIDLNNKTYKTTFIDDDVTELEQESVIRETTNYQSDAGILSTYYHNAQVKLLTQDPVFVDLCYTINRLYWKTYDIGDYWYTDITSSYVDAWAANPSDLFTNWYIDDYGGHRSKDERTQQVAYNVFGYYYNYNFGDPDKRTDVYHYVDLYGEKFGDFTYDVYYDVYGEAKGLLHSRVYVN